MPTPPDLPSTLPLWQAFLLLGPALASGAAALSARPGATVVATWRGARWASNVAVVCAASVLVAVLFGVQGSANGMRADAVGGTVLLVVAFVGWVIVRYSQRYLNGEVDERHYVRWLMATLATVGVVVTTNHVLVLAIAWTGTSLALHKLLTFYGSRPPAVVAAHKKFLVGRLADLCMLGAAGLLFLAFGTLHIDRIVLQAAAASELPAAAHAGVLLIVGAALLKSAQLPFHGWLIQVMEAPTPISALLHAGVVNLGGFVLMRFGPLVLDVPAAQVMLVAVGALTAVLGALVMTTRISVKVMLAWSTCAQMGFMLMQCGLGAWEMALLHLVAHSLYKAHAFLGAGGAVRRAQLVQLTPPAAAPGPAGLAVGAIVGVGMVLAAGLAWGWLVPQQPVSPASWVLAGIVALSLAPLVHAQAWRLGGSWLLALGAGAFGVAFAYVGLHTLLATWLRPLAAVPPLGLCIAVAIAFGGLFLLQALITALPAGATARRLYPWFYGGLFLDEWFSRLVFRLWPPPLPKHADASRPSDHTPIGSDTGAARAGAHA